MTTTTMTMTHRPLIAGVLAAGPRRQMRLATPVSKDLCPDRRPAAAPDDAPRPCFSAAEQDAVRFAARDGRASDDRAIDCVVDRLLRELSW